MFFISRIVETLNPAYPELGSPEWWDCQDGMEPWELDALEDSKYDESYGVVCTDTGNEQFFDLTALEKFIFGGKEYRQVMGVDVDAKYHTIDGITPYQHEKYLIPQQKELLRLTGVDLRRYKDEITLLSPTKECFQGCVRIRLSDYGSSMAWSVLPSEDEFGVFNGQTYVLVLDDKIEMLGDEPRIPLSYAQWDIRNVTDKSRVEALYRTLFEIQGFNRKKDIDRYLLDIPERRAYWWRKSRKW